MADIIRLRDLPEISPSRFQPYNSILWLHIPTVCWLDTASGFIDVDDDFFLIGCCRRTPEQRKREGNIGIMIFSEEHGEVWQHYPISDDEHLQAAKFRQNGGRWR